MGMMAVTVEGREFRWYDNGGSIYTARIQPGHLPPDVDYVGRYESPDELWLFAEDEHGEENRRKAEDHDLGRLRAIAIAWLKAHPAPTEEITP